MCSLDHASAYSEVCTNWEPRNERVVEFPSKGELVPCYLKLLGAPLAHDTRPP